MRPAKREIVRGGLPIRSSATTALYRSCGQHRHNQCRCSHGEGLALASHPILAKSSGAYYFDSYGIVPLVPAIRQFLRRNCTVWHYKKRQLQGLTSNVCGKYSCLFDLYKDRSYNPQQFVGLFDAEKKVDRQIERAFTSEFGPLQRHGSGGQCRSSLL